MANELPTRRCDGCGQIWSSGRFLDPTAVVARNHLLVLFSRHGAFDEAEFERLAYEERALFEYWAHEASYVLSEDLPIHRHLMRPPGGWRTRMAAWWESEHEFRAHILARLTEAGPLRAREIEDRAKVPWESSGWTNARNVASISSRAGTSKVRSMKSRISAWCAGSSTSRELWSYHSYSRDPGSTGACGFVQLISRWKTGKRRNIPAGWSSREMTASRSTPARARQYADWRPPGPLPTTTTS